MAALKSVRADGLRAGRELEKSPADALYRSRSKTSKRSQLEMDQSHHKIYTSPSSAPRTDRIDALGSRT